MSPRAWRKTHTVGASFHHSNLIGGTSHSSRSGSSTSSPIFCIFRPYTSQRVLAAISAPGALAGFGSVAKDPSDFLNQISASIFFRASAPSAPGSAPAAYPTDRSHGGSDLPACTGGGDESLCPYCGACRSDGRCAFSRRIGWLTDWDDGHTRPFRHLQGEFRLGAGYRSTAGVPAEARPVVNVSSLAEDSLDCARDVERQIQRGPFPCIRDDFSDCAARLYDYTRRIMK